MIPRNPLMVTTSRFLIHRAPHAPLSNSLMH